MAEQSITARLIIEPLRTDHAEGLFQALDHPEVSAHFDEPEVTTLERLRERIGHLLVGAPADRAPERWHNWVVRTREPPETPVIGRLEATTYDGWAEIAYVFDPGVWGRGFATEAAEWMVDQLAAAGVHELWACLAPGNERSRRLVERLGFEPVAGPPPRPLASYDPGDLVFRRPLGRSG